MRVKVIKENKLKDYLELLSNMDVINKKLENIDFDS
jgi:hypothetical protein